MSTVANRGNWTSRFGFIVAAAGSAIGLGNIWRFPYTAGQNGGGAFVLVYLGFVLLVGIPVLLAELSVGRASQRNPVGAFKALVPKSLWPWVGLLGVLTGFGILAFYSVIAGWTLRYLIWAVSGQFSGGITAEQSGELFTSLVGGTTTPILLSGMFLALTAWVVRGGISLGIERATKILMPIFGVILVLLAIRALTLEGAGEGLRFLFAPDFSKLTVKTISIALGQALFSLSLGMGAMITYGSYLPKNEKIPVAGCTVAFFDTSIAILAGLIIFPTLFHAGASPGGGPGLVFVVMPTIFGTMPFGTLFAIAFYALLSIAALTSTISLLEVIVAYFVDEKGWGRGFAAWVLAGTCFVLAIPSALSVGGNRFLSNLLGEGSGFLDLQNIIFGNYSLSIGALCLCIFVGWRWGIPKALAEIENSGYRMQMAPVWGFLVRYFCPVAVAVVLGYILVTRDYF